MKLDPNTYKRKGRAWDEMRKIEMKVGIIPNAVGSAMVSMGRTKAIAGVYGPRELHPRRKQLTNKVFLHTVYAMLPFSTSERVRPGPSRRSNEICKVTREALEPAVFVEEFPKATIDVYMNIIQAEAGTRTAAINAASLALADAGIPMRDLVTSVAAGKIKDNFVLDLEGKEEEITACDMPIAYMPRKKKITLLQLDGDLSPDDAKNVMALAVKGCEMLYDMQKKALKEKWVK